MRIPLFDMTRQYKEIRDEIIKAIDQAIMSGRVILGENVKEFEREVSEFLKVKYAVGVASGSDALVLSLHALNVEQGDYVITTPYTFFATASAIVRNGAIPIFVDVEERYYNIDLDQVEDILNNHPEKERIKGIIPVHLFGKTVDLERLKKIEERYGVFVLEDAAQSFGSVWKGKDKEFHSATVGTAGIFSFFPTKNLGTYGDGGMVVTNDEKLYERVRKLRVHGATKKYFHDEIGYNSRLDEIHAAVLRVKLKYIRKWNKNRQKIAGLYKEYFKNYQLEDLIEYPEAYTDNTHVYHQYVVTVKRGNRDELREFLREKGIGTSIYYPLPLHLQKCFEFLGYKEGQLPVSERASKTTLALPIFPEMTEEEVEYVVKNIKEFFNRNGVR